MTTSSSVVKSVGSIHFTDAADTTEQLTSWDHGAFESGATTGMDDDGIIGRASLSEDEYWEWEACFQIIDADVSPADTIDFRRTDFSNDPTYENIPRATVAAATAETWPGWVQSRGGWT